MDELRDAEKEYNVRPGHLFPGVPRLPADFGHRMHTLEDIVDLEQQLEKHKEEVEHRLEELRLEKEKLMAASGSDGTKTDADLELSEVAEA